MNLRLPTALGGVVRRVRRVLLARRVFVLNAGVNHVHHEIWGRLERRARVPDVFQPPHDAVFAQRAAGECRERRSAIHLAAVREQHGGVEKRHDARSWLMDGRHHRRPMSAHLSVGYAPELVDHEERGGRVQTAGGLVEQ